MNRRYQWLLFDADGTLLDYEAAEAQALKKALEAFGFTVDDEIRQLYHKINSALWAELEKGTITSPVLRVKRFRDLADSLNWKVEAEDLSSIYLQELGKGGFMMPGAMDMLNRLSGDFEKVIITNGIRDVQYGRLAAAGILDMFSHVIISEDAGIAKPAAGYFDYMVDRIGFDDVSQMLVIGDSLTSDMAGGVGYGIDTCWFNPRRLDNTAPFEPTFEIADWPEFFSVIK